MALAPHLTQTRWQHRICGRSSLNVHISSARRGAEREEIAMNKSQVAGVEIRSGRPSSVLLQHQFHPPVAALSKLRNFRIQFSARQMSRVSIATVVPACFSPCSRLPSSSPSPPPALPCFFPPLPPTRARRLHQHTRLGWLDPHRHNPSPVPRPRTNVARADRQAILSGPGSGLLKRAGPSFAAVHEGVRHEKRVCGGWLRVSADMVLGSESFCGRGFQDMRCECCVRLSRFAKLRRAGWTRGIEILHASCRR